VDLAIERARERRAEREAAKPPDPSSLSPLRYSGSESCFYSSFLSYLYARYLHAPAERCMQPCTARYGPIARARSDVVGHKG
jgi:hypothetical protein